MTWTEKTCWNPGQYGGRFRRDYRQKILSIPSPEVGAHMDAIAGEIDGHGNDAEIHTSLVSAMYSSWGDAAGWTIVRAHPTSRPATAADGLGPWTALVNCTDIYINKSQWTTRLQDAIEKPSILCR